MTSATPSKRTPAPCSTSSLAVCGVFIGVRAREASGVIFEIYLVA
ncbi:MAG TPA: hypothetical protein VMG37_12240 [Solirubrobacteraceae bacterium]|nr:hypothetical protein [Solirubrobacteraceae bacterium]